MPRRLYLNFNNSTTITADNTSQFTVKAYSYSGTTASIIDKGNSTFVYSVTPPTGLGAGYPSTGYQVSYNGLGNDNYVIWQVGLYNVLTGTTTTTGLTYANLHGANYQLDINQGVGLVEIDASGMCNTTAFGETISTVPGQVAVPSGDTVYTTYDTGFTASNIPYSAYTHTDLTQITSTDAQGFNYPPAIVVRATNENRVGSATGDTVTATLYYTGVTYGQVGSTGTTTYTGTFPPIVFNRTLTPPDKYNGVFGTPTNPGNGDFYHIFDYLPAETNVGIHRGLWTFKLVVSTGGNLSTPDASKYVSAFLINNNNP
jgi:hypothetical protein